MTRAAASIQAHGVVGDGRSAALVADDGTVDWLCWPRFDSDATLAALLHDASAGAWELRPVGAWTSAQRYVPETNVLVTEFRAGGARVRITDLMPIASAEERRRVLLPEHELVRLVDCEGGEAELVMRLCLAPGFAQEASRAARRGPGELRLDTRHGAYFVRSERPLAWSGTRATAAFRMRAGERVRLSLVWAPEAPAVLPPLAPAADAALERTVRHWRAWAGRARYEGPHRDAVVRSALALGLLQYPPSGALLAAATTSLPEALGGGLNWDYRFCWLRDAAFTVRALYRLGYRAEADAFVSWMLHTTRLTRPRLAVLYDVFGNPPRPERELAHLDGYAGSRPVRLGNAAASQLQLDLHGEVIDAICAFVEAGGALDRESRRLLCAYGRCVARGWRRPDASLWEYRTPPEHHTHSKVLCWAALDGLLRLHADGQLPRLDAAATRAEREAIAHAVRTEAVDARSGGYASVLGGAEPDAALLLLPAYGFEPAGTPRMRATLAHVRRALGAPGGLLHRNRRLRAEGDGAFLACGFWGVACVADGAGPLAEAERWFDALLAHAGPLGLLAEEVDAATGRALGNFPQAFSHVGLVTAALALEARRAREARGARPVWPSVWAEEARA